MDLESLRPAIWSAERDSQLLKAEWSVGKKTYYLRRCPSDSQVWLITEEGDASLKSLGIMVVYVDDFLLQTKEGPVRDGFLAALGKVWTLNKEETLRIGGTLRFLGIEMHMRKSGDIVLHQRAFIQSSLDKYHKSPINENKAVQMDKLPAERLPTLAELKVLQCLSGEFNWLATRTRLDLSYSTSLLASSCSKHADWSLDLAKKILRFLAWPGPAI